MLLKCPSCSRYSYVRSYYLCGFPSRSNPKESVDSSRLNRTAICHSNTNSATLLVGPPQPNPKLLR